MGKNKKVKNNKQKEEVKNVAIEEVKKDNEIVEEKVEEKKSKKQEKKNKEQETKKVENKKEEKDNKDNKDNKKDIVFENKYEKSLVKKAKKAANRDTKIIVGIVLAVIIIALGIFGFYFYKLNTDVIATYDGGKVTAAEYEVYYKTFAPMLEYYGYPASIIPEQIVNKAALDKIIVEMAEKEGVKISDENKKSVEDVFNDKEQLASFTEQGIDIGRMKKLYLNDYLISAYLEKLQNEASDEDVVAYIKSTNGENAELDMNQYNTSHILIKTSNSDGAALSDEEKASKKQQAQTILERVKNGEDFAALAKELSEDAGTKENGGQYTMYADGNTMEQYEKAVKTLKDGEIYGEIVETEAGYHIIKLDSKVENGRAKNETEREEYIDSKINSLAEEKNLNVDKEALNILIEKITGKSVENTDDSSTGLDSVTDETQTENNETTENNAENTNTETTENQAQ